MKKKLSVRKQARIGYTWCGIAWVLVGIASMFGGILGDVIELAGCGVCVLILIYILKVNKEDSDEMARENLCKAKAWVLDIMHLLYCAIAVLAMLLLEKTNLEPDWSKVIPTVLFVTMGIKNMLIGFYFRKLEEE